MFCKAIPRVFCLASNYVSGEQRIIGSLALSAINSFNRNRARLQPVVAKSSRPRLILFPLPFYHTPNATCRASSVEDAVRRGQRQVEQVKIKMGMQMDDKTFQSCLLETQVGLISVSNEFSLVTPLTGDADEGLHQMEF
jgi:rapamycin-insensitive companion of mTOR